ncbi:hypothetical protein D5086_002130 [Populus alba]|uniref:Uncharacterized protein n=1 Tax=Populus alba TaxID=43335 RepID=A0ACC4D1U4_POPAL
MHGQTTEQLKEEKKYPAVSMPFKNTSCNLLRSWIQLQGSCTLVQRKIHQHDEDSWCPVANSPTVTSTQLSINGPYDFANLMQWRLHDMRTSYTPLAKRQH